MDRFVHRVRLLAPILALLASLAGTHARADAPEPEEGPPRATLEVRPDTANVGDRLAVTLTVEAPPGAEIEERDLGASFGPFSVIDGRWNSAEQVDGLVRRTWTGTISAYRTGELEIPAIGVDVRSAGGDARAKTAPLTVRIEALLDEGEEAKGEDALAGLKAPASLPAEYGPLWIALILVGGLLAAAAVLWWLHRRYGSRLAAAAVPDDPFRRTPPHVWVYAELKKLLERRLDEAGQVDLFFEELARIVKRYLEGRYRVDLMERTTGEVPDGLAQAAAPAEAVQLVRGLLERADQVKFAGERPGPGACREAVETAYRIVDVTRPADEPRAPSEKGAA